MKHMAPPVLAYPDVRERYDREWALYPWEHPEAYWLRANTDTAVCTRCGSDRFVSAEHNPDDQSTFGVAFLAWCAKHLKCQLGHGLVEGGPEPVDPLFEEGS